MGVAERVVLVVEPDPAELAAVVSLLRANGHCTISAAGFEEALRSIAHSSPDLLITNLRLGSYNGLHLLFRARAKRPDLPAIVTTCHPDPVLEVEAGRAQARHMLQPLDGPDFLDAVAELLSASAIPNTDRRVAERRRISQAG